MDIKKQLNIAGEGAKLVAKQAERMKIANVSLPSAYKKLGEEVYKAGILRNDLNDIYSKIDSSIKQQEDLNHTGPAAEGFAEKMKAAAKSAKNLAVSKKMEFDRGGMFSELGRFAFENHTNNLSSEFSLGIVKKELEKLALLDEEIEKLNSVGKGSFFNAKNIAIGLVSIFAIAIAIVGLSLFKNKKNPDPATASSSKENNADQLTSINKTNPPKPISSKTNYLLNEPQIIKEDDPVPPLSANAIELSKKLEKSYGKIYFQFINGQMEVAEVDMDGRRGVDLDQLEDAPFLKSLKLGYIETFELLKPMPNVISLEISSTSNLKNLNQHFPSLKFLKIKGPDIINPADIKFQGSLSEGLTNLNALEVLVINSWHPLLVKQTSLPDSLKYFSISPLNPRLAEGLNTLIDNHHYDYLEILEIPYDYRSKDDLHDLLASADANVLRISALTNDRVKVLLDNSKIQKTIVNTSIKSNQKLSTENIIKLTKNSDRILGKGDDFLKYLVNINQIKGTRLSGQKYTFPDLKNKEEKQRKKSESSETNGQSRLPLNNNSSNYNFLDIQNPGKTYSKTELHQIASFLINKKVRPGDSIQTVISVMGPPTNRTRRDGFPSDEAEKQALLDNPLVPDAAKNQMKKVVETCTWSFSEDPESKFIMLGFSDGKLIGSDSSIVLNLP